ncbi:pancreatic lipase-related protein 2-like [Bicyclus anynana]|uniref:Pancreatic lipase-related protein 2-like n=1 Tax=Bicyclus anynana TaxID=110368 RepID=A0A6J1P2L9_BICAN|nr:pancreatic lipase-related protein 2-like [Bicyclus anynana]
MLIFLACSAFAEPINRNGRNAGTNDYFLYTRRNRATAQTLVIDNVNSITTSNFDAKCSTIVAIHGWVDDSHSEFNQAIKNAYLEKNDVNIIMVDWSPLSQGSYTAAVSGVPKVGRDLGQFISFLTTTTGASLDNVHLIGFSLGAHVAGNAGRALGGKVARITGLDPAGPLWAGNSNCLKASDAVYVEVIHSDGSLVGLGIPYAVGDVDFFPNGGTGQPGCSDMFCNHNRAWELFAATVTFNNLVANQCANMIQVATNSCRGQQLHMGNDQLNKRGSGLYRVNTKAKYPF